MKNLSIKNAIASKLCVMIFYGEIIPAKNNDKIQTIFAMMRERLYRLFVDEYFSIDIYIDSKDNYRISISLKQAYSIKIEAKEAFLFELNYLLIWLRGQAYEIILPLKPKNEEELKTILCNVKELMLRYSDYNEDSYPEPSYDETF